MELGKADQHSNRLTLICTQSTFDEFHTSSFEVVFLVVAITDLPLILQVVGDERQLLKPEAIVVLRLLLLLTLLQMVYAELIF